MADFEIKTGRERMKYKSLVSCCSLMAGIVGITLSPASAGVRIGNLSRSYADSYNQVNALRMGTVAGDSAAPRAGQATGAGVTTGIDATGAVIDLPVRVANEDLAKKLALGQRVGNVDINTLEKCRRVYPDGEMAWDTPTAGRGSGGAQTCVAVVEMRAVSSEGDGNYVVLARANVAAGDSMKCNIEDFPEYSYTKNVETITFPADRAPTMDDVVAVMNQEQKQNAGLKIAAGALIGAVGGNIAGKAERGSDSLFGTGTDKRPPPAVGALSGAAVMAGNSYAGKVGGDVILSTGVNAAAGGMIGNMMASGNSVLRIEECEINGVKQSCLWGTYVKTKEFTIGENNVDSAFYNINTHESVVCMGKDRTNCKGARLHNVRLKADEGRTIEDLQKDDFQAIKGHHELQFKFDKTKAKVDQGGSDGDNIYAEIATATEEDGMPLRAMVAGVRDKTFGMSGDDWAKWRGNNPKAKVWGRDYNGDAYELEGDASLENFEPLYVDAEDGGLVDISNKARLKGTLTGAGVGGALGGFVGYQGAQNDINERWLSATREYKDSLTSVYCVSGSRYMGKYNDELDMPLLIVDEE